MLKLTQYKNSYILAFIRYRLEQLIPKKLTMLFPNKKKRLRFLLLLTCLISFLLLHFYIPRFITEIRNPVLSKARAKKHNVAINTAASESHAFFRSFDETQLAYSIQYTSSPDVNGTIILLHGIRSRKEQFVNISQYMNSLGYHTVALDLRAHGRSEGAHCTFGVKEKKDVSALIDHLINEKEISSNIGILGQSLGGAIGLQAMGNDPRIKFGIIESTFSDFSLITNDYFKYHLGFNFQPLTNYLINRAGKIAEFDPHDANPLAYCQQINQPILMVHGTEDRRISIQYAHQNFNAIPSKRKKLIELEGANHTNVWAVGGSNYFNQIAHFLQEVRTD